MIAGNVFLMLQPGYNVLPQLLMLYYKLYFTANNSTGGGGGGKARVQLSASYAAGTVSDTIHRVD